MKKTILLIVIALLVLTGCSGIYNRLADSFGGGVKVEMPKPTVEDETDSDKAFTPVDTNSQNVQKVIEGLQSAGEFRWEFESTYTYQNQAITYKSTVCVRENQFRVDVYNGSKFVSSAIYDGEYLYDLNIAQEVVKKSKPVDPSYYVLAMAADIETLFPIDQSKIKGTYLADYNGENTIYIEIENNGITETYHLSEQNSVPLFAQCAKEENVYYTLKTVSFSDETLDPDIFKVNTNQ